jgi:hypothetical protein
MDIGIRPRKVGGLCAACIAVLVAAHVLSQIARFGFGHAYLMGFGIKIYLGSEASIPNWFSTLLLLACGAALLVIAAGVTTNTAHWRWLGIIFIALSLDESAALHDLSAPLFTGAMGWLARVAGGPFVALKEKPGYAWLIPGVIFSLAVAASYVRFLAALPRPTRVRFVLAGAIYVGGAAGFEALGGWYSGLFGSRNVTFITLLTIEETLEMVGASLFLYALLVFIEEQFGEIRIRLAGSRLEEARSPTSGSHSVSAKERSGA